jgi:hypothetical protein
VKSFEIAVSRGIMHRVKGHVFGEWGVHTGPKGFTVSHVPSGRALVWAGSEDVACRIARALDAEVRTESFPDSPPVEYELPLLDHKAVSAITRVLRAFGARPRETRLDGSVESARGPAW